MSEPLVSIVVPVYKGMPYLSALVNSISQQTYGNVELIATVTPSGDGSEQVLRNAGFTVIETPVGTTAADNWTIATNAATGEFTKLVCQDDVIYPQAISSQVEDLQHNPEAVMASAQRDIIDSQGRVLFRHRGLAGLTRSPIKGVAALRKTYTYGGNIFGEPLANLFRTEVLKSVMPWRDDNPLMLDLNTYAAVAPLGQIALRHESVGAFRVSAHSWSTQIGRQQLQHTKQWQAEYVEVNSPGRIDRMRALLGRHVQTTTRRAAYTYLSMRGVL